MTFPVMFEVYKPKQRLLEEDTYQSKPQIAAKMIRELQAMGFKFQLVLADSLYGERDSNFLSVLYELQLNLVVAIRSNHGVWLPKGQKVRSNRWRLYNRIFSDGKQEKRYIREIVFGKRRTLQYWQVTTDPETLPENSTWFIMTKVPAIKYRLFHLNPVESLLVGLLEKLACVKLIIRQSKKLLISEKKNNPSRLDLLAFLV